MFRRIQTIVRRKEGEREEREALKPKILDTAKMLKM